MPTRQNQTSYDRIPYESGAFTQTHPNRLATIGRLFGMSPAPVDKCRVLELGCAAGGNLIPMAYNLPQSEFIGVDASCRQIGIGHKKVSDLELTNIKLHHQNILDLDTTIGNFDFIIAHGVYSWVPDAVQEKILDIVADHLTPEGIAYVSYNTYPGWHTRKMIREMMFFHIQEFDTPETKIEQARALLRFLSDSVPLENNHYGMMLKEELDLIQGVKDWYLFHDHLEEINNPIYFHIFNERAKRKKLQYLGEADFSTMLSIGFSENISETLNRISPDIIKSEQYMDFLRNRKFRQTLLCRESIPLKRELSSGDAAGFLFSSSARPLSEPVNLAQDVQQSFETQNGVIITTPSAITKAALCALHTYWPRAVNLEALYSDAMKMLAEHDIFNSNENEKGQYRDKLLNDLLHCYCKNVIEFHMWQADFSNEISDYPKVSRLAAYFANMSSSTVNQRHETVSLDPLAHQMINMLDGAKNHSQINAALVSLVRKGELIISKNDKRLEDTGSIRREIKRMVSRTLNFMCQSAMLVE